MAFQENLTLMLLHVYKGFRFSEVMEQMFLTVRGAVQGSFRAGVASVSVHVVLRPGLGAWRCFHPTSVFSLVLI